MSFTGRIRLFLIAVALFPPALMMLVVYVYSSSQEETRYHQSAADDLRKLAEYRLQFREQLVSSLQNVASHTWFERSLRLAERGRAAQVDFADVRASGLDFYELISPDGRVVASDHRPGLVSEPLSVGDGQSVSDSAAIYETVEYDVEGRHAALAGTWRGASGYRIYGGYYLERRFIPMARNLIHGNLGIRFAEGNSPAGAANLTHGSLYRSGDSLLAVLFGDNEVGYTLKATFARPDQSAVFASFTDAISLVALVSVLAAVGLGIFIAARARREFDNLIDAFGRVAGGDLSTAVMAYSEGEFSNLADSFSEMTGKLRRSQERLATSEKIAAWQTMARKIAHEIKNPLTPIGLSADDLRRSYQEKLPGFDQTLDKSTRLIRSEIQRLTRLLDEFVSFARMKPPEVREVEVSEIVARLNTLYRDQVSDGRLLIVDASPRAVAKADPDLIEQMLVNLIKNGFESGESTTVTVSFASEDNGLQVTVSDTGPGFSPTVLKRQFEPYLSSKKDGTGLGLVICQRIVHDHGGRIELRNRDEGGAEVIVRIPQN